MICALVFICFSAVAASTEVASPSHESVTTMLERSHKIQEEGFKALNKAFDILDRAFSFVESQTRTSDDDLESTESLDRIVDRLDKIEAAISEDRNFDKITRNLTEKFDSLENKVDAKLGQLQLLFESATENSSRKIEQIDEKVESLESTVSNKTSLMEQKIDASVILSEKSVQLGTTIQTRQQAWLSEVRLISLHKLTGENNPHSLRDFNPGLVVDGHFIFSNRKDNMRTFSHKQSGSAGNKIWIKLGGLFRVYSVRVWNIRDGSRPLFAGANIYVDDTLIGTAAGDYGFHDFSLPEEKVVYGSKVTLHHQRADYIIVLEVQVWGNGPYNSTDCFN